jgi:hypothetical protein
MIDKRITTRKNFQGGGKDASTTSFSESYDRAAVKAGLPDPKTRTKANKTVDREQREGQDQADRDNRRIELNRLARQSAAEKEPDVVKKNPFQRAGGGIGSLLMSILGFAMGIPGLGLAFSKKGMNFMNKKLRGTNKDGSIRTQAEYEQSMEDKRQQNRVTKLLKARDRGYNQIGFGDFTKKTVDFTPNQQALLNDLIAQGYGPTSLNNPNPTFETGNPEMNLNDTIKELASPSLNNINNNDFIGTTGQSSEFNTGLINEFEQSPQFKESLINEFEVADKGIMDSNAAFAFGLPYGTADDQGANLLGVPEMTAALPNNNLMAFAPNSINDRKLKNLYSGYENLGIKDPQLIDLMQQDLLENKEKGTPLSLPQSTYSLIG